MTWTFHAEGFMAAGGGCRRGKGNTKGTHMLIRSLGLSEATEGCNPLSAGVWRREGGGASAGRVMRRIQANSMGSTCGLPLKDQALNGPKWSSSRP